MAVLTWKNLPLPGVSTSMRDVDQFINRAFEQALGGVNQIQQYNQENADRAILQRALAIQDPEEYARALAEGQITGPDRANASMDMLRFVDSRRSDLKKEEQQDFQYGRERRLAERDDYLYDRRRGFEPQANELFRRAIMGDREGVAEDLKNVPYEDLIQFGQLLQQGLGGAEKKQHSDRTYDLQERKLRHQQAQAAAARRAASQQQTQAQRKQLVGRIAAQIYSRFRTPADYEFGLDLIMREVDPEYQAEVRNAYVAMLSNSPTAQQGQSTGGRSSQGGSTSSEQNFSSETPTVSPLVQQADPALGDQLNQFIEAGQDRFRTIDSENPYREDIPDNISQGDAIDVLQKRLGKGANVGKIQEKFIEFKKKYPHLTNGEITNFMLNSIAPTSWSKGLGNKTTFSEKRFEAQAVRVGDIRKKREDAERLKRDFKDIADIQDRLDYVNKEIQRISGLSPTEATARRLNELQHEASQLFNRLRQYGPRAIVEQSGGDEAQETGTTSPSEPVAAETEIEKDNRKRYRVSSVGKVNGEERFRLSEIKTPESNSGYEYKWSSTSPRRQEIIDNRILLSEHKEVTDRYEELFKEKTRRYQGRGRGESSSLYGRFPEIEEEIVQELRAEGFNINAPINPHIERKKISETEKVISHFEDKLRTSAPRKSNPNLDLASKYQQSADGTDNPVIKYNELVNKHIALAGANPEKLDRKSQLYQRARLAAAEEMDKLGIGREVYGGPKNLNAPQNSLPVASNPKHDPEPVITSKSINVNTGEETTPINIPKSAFKDAPTEQAVQARPGAIPEGLGTKVLVTFVKDGDSFNYQDPVDPNVNLECRLDTVDAPETAKRDREGNVFQEGQPYGEEAAAFLEELILNREVNILVTRTDHRGRNICQVEVEGVEVDQQLLENGLAYLYEHFVSPLNPRMERLQSAQERARERGVGIFSLPPEQQESPYDFRQRTIGQR